MSKRLEINEQLIELADDTIIALDFSINDIADVDIKSGIRSNKFKAPFSQPNLKALGWANNITSTTLLPYRIGAARYEQNGIQIMPRANCIIEQSNQGFDLTIYDGNAKLFQAIGNKKLSDLDLSDLDHYWDLTNILASRTNTDGYIYGIIDWGNLASGGNTIYTWQMMPCIFIHDLVTRIFNEAGFTKSGAYLDSNFYKRLVLDLTFENGLAYDDALVDEQLFKTFVAGGSPPNVGSATLVYDAMQTFRTRGTDILDPIPFDNEDFDNGNNFDDTLCQAVIDLPGKYIFSGLVDIGNIVVTPPSDWTGGPFVQGFTTTTIEMKLNGVTIQSWNDVNGTFGPSGSIQILSTERFFYSGDEIKFVLTIFFEFNWQNNVFGLPYAVNNAQVDYEVMDTSFIQNAFNADIQPGGFLSIASLIGNMKQIDLLKDIANISGIIWQTDQFSNDVEWHEFQEVSDNKPNAKDWSQKIDAKTRPTVEYRLPKYARSNFFKYAEDENVEIDATGTLSVDDETLTPETTIVQLKLGATDMVERLSGLMVPFIDRYTTTSNETGTPPTFGTWTKKQKQRILIMDRQTIDNLDTDDLLDLLTDDGDEFVVEGVGGIAGNINYSDNVTTTNVTTNIPLMYFVLPGKDYNLAFNDSLLDTFYPALASVLNYPKIVTDIFKLSEKDIAELDHFTPVYLNINNEFKNINGYFYINKIKGFRSDRMTQVNLIRI